MSTGDHRLVALARRACLPTGMPRQDRVPNGRAPSGARWGDEIGVLPARAAATSASNGSWDLSGEELPLPEALHIAPPAARSRGLSEPVDWVLAQPDDAADANLEQSGAEQEDSAEEAEAREKDEENEDAEAGKALSADVLDREVMSLAARRTPIAASPDEDEDAEDEELAAPMSAPQPPAGAHAVFDGMRMGLQAPHTFALGVFDLDAQLDRIERALAAERARTKSKPAATETSVLPAAVLEAEIRSMPGPQTEAAREAQPPASAGATTDRSNDHGRETA